MRKFLLVAASLFWITPALAADNWHIDPRHSSATFTIRHMMISNVRGQFLKFQGKAVYDGKNLQAASVQASIDVASVDTHDAQRDGDLKSPDFFDVAKYPEIKFASTKITPTQSGFDMAGDLTIHGITKPVVLHCEKLSGPSKDPWGGVRMGTIATTQINRKDFGLSYNQQIDNGGFMVGDDVAIELDMELLKDKD